MANIDSKFILANKEYSVTETSLNVVYKDNKIYLYPEVSAKTEDQTIDYEMRQVRLYHNNGFNTNVSEFEELKGKKFIWESAFNEEKEEAGCLYAINHENLVSGTIEIIDFKDDILVIKWSGLANIFWNEPFANNVPFETIFEVVIPSQKTNNIQDIDKENLFNDGVQLLDTLLNKFLKEQNIPESEAQKYFINYPDSYYSCFEIDKEKAGKFVTCFPIYLFSDDNKATIQGYFKIVLEDNLLVKTYQVASEHLVTKNIDELKRESNYDMIVNLAKLYYLAKGLKRFEEDSDDYKKALSSYCTEMDNFKEKIKIAEENKKTEVQHENKENDPIDEAVDNVTPELTNIIDEIDDLIKRLNAGNSENKAYGFEWNEDPLLFYADDRSLKVAYILAEKGKISLAKEENKICIYSYLKAFCEYNMTDEELLNNYEKDNNCILSTKQGTWKFAMGRAISTEDCGKCKYQSCPKFLAAYIVYLKNTGKLKEKLAARIKFRKENDVKNGFFLFEWKNKNGLKKINDEAFNFANELVDKEYIRLPRRLDKNGKMSSEQIYTCKDIQLCNMDISKLKPNIEWKDSRFLTRNTNAEPDGFCEPYNCRLSCCPTLVAAYIYYLKHSGQEEKIKEDREYYASHKEEIDEEIKQKIDDAIKALKQKKEEKLQDIKESYDGKIENLSLTINSILESDKTNFHCIVAGDDEDEKNNFIEKIIELLKSENNIKNIRRMPASHFARLFYHSTNLRINKDEKLVYFDNEIEDPRTYKRDKQTVPYVSGTSVNRKNILEDNAIYVLEDINEFVNDFRDLAGKYNDEKMMLNAVDVLTDMSSNRYIIIKAVKDEIDPFISLDTRLKFVYQNNIITIPSYSIDDMYNSYLKALNTELLIKLNQDDDEYKKQFNEYVSLNKNFMPFSKREIVNYLATYANSRNELVLPPKIYKKENLDNIIGLETVKEKLKEFEKYMLFQIQAKANDIDIAASNMHIIFTGNPGTGKTTVARIMARMLFDLGIIKENKCIEVERKDLIGRYIGQTASKTAEVIDRAMGGVLFIDEAYSLASGSSNDFGAEAIATLIKAMEDHKDKLVVIFAGYKNEMKDFTDMNPGIASRIGYTFDFPDYSVDELMQIFYLKLRNSGFEYNDDLELPLRKLCDYYSRRKNFGNGRFIDKVIQETLMKHALSERDNIKLIVVDDIPSIEDLNNNTYKNSNAETAEEMLDQLIGMENIKRELRLFGDYAEFVKKAEKQKIKIPNANMHMIFTGNPGTGKTTIARIVAKMLFEMEIIHENKLIEVEKKDLIAPHVGQTAAKTADLIERAMGGVLFIDEAYSLAQGSSNDFGAEAIATLIKAMEDHKGDLVVIFAGYKDEMKTFIDMNSGIASRIGYTFNFEDYSVTELMEIFYKKMKKYGFECEQEVEIALKRVCDYYSRRKNFGNGRFVDKVIQNTLTKHAYSKSENIKLITESDIPSIEELNQNTIKNGNNIEEMLSNIVGMNDLKQEIISFGNYITFVKEAEKQRIKIPNFNMHMIFTGNPGTGKTTIARIIAKMLFDMEVIHENKLVEVERKDLVAGYTGQTAIKTAEVIDKAMGGVLFIDEAYSLANDHGSQHSFGDEAIATLIKAMEDHKGEFVVIFAGYKREMGNFLDTNPGIASRVGFTFNFEDYSDKELTEIFSKKVLASGMTIEDGVLEEVQKIMKYFYRVENIGNGRFVDKVFSKTLLNHSKKFTQNSLILPEDVATIKSEDLPTIQDITKTLLDGNSMIDPSRISKEDMRKTAIHEIGHATVGYLLLKQSGIKKITCAAEGMGALGYVEYDNSNVSYTSSKEDLLNKIKRLLAGIGAEEVFLGIYENGGSSDLQKATQIARNIIVNYGMSDLGLAHVSGNNPEIEKLIYEEENKILGKCFEEVKELIAENKEKMERVVDYLLEHSEIDEEQFIKVFNKKTTKKSEK